MADEIDLVKYGAMFQKVEDLGKKMDKIETDLGELTDLANKSKGGFWAGMVFVSLVSTMFGYIVDHINLK
jgi:hypothetical protein